jgi:hypothetical protein
MLDALKDLNSARKWMSGAKNVDGEAKAVLAVVRDLDKLKKGARKVGGTYQYDEAGLKRVLDGVGKTAQAISDAWRDELKAVTEAHSKEWPTIENDARERYRRLTDLEAAEGIESPAFAKALKETIAYIEGYRETLYERETYAQVVAGKMSDLQKAFLDANGAANALKDAIEPATWSLKTFGTGTAADKMMRQLIALRNGIGSLPDAVARLYEIMAESAAKHAAQVNGERGRVDAGLKRLYAMQGEKVLHDVRDFLGDLSKAA